MSQVDVIIPCYKYGCYLRECVSSVLQQSHQDLRILVIDDASPDQTAEIARALCKEDPRVSFIAHAQNRGHIATYNEGIDWANGDYLLILSADDLLASGALRRAVAVMDDNPAVGMTYGACMDLVPTDPIPEPLDDEADDPPWEIMEGTNLITKMCRLGNNVVPTPTAIVRTAMQKRIGGYLTELYHAGDVHMWLRFAACGDVARTPALQAFKRDHGQNMSTEIFAQLVPDYQQRRAVFRALFEEYGDSVPAGAYLDSQARRSMAENAFWHGMGKLVEGRISVARELFGFAYSTCPEMVFHPPIGRLLRMNRVPHKVWISVRGLVLNVGRRFASQ
jgi:glycosyltransferase involved in cell wall biosynthesis